ncbi:hypothetical protein ACFQY4_29290 [Catellatospora bangladeshensis]|uniref:hypothetical protein n=1 Tax=Catellatospora bangladeshensis TaxID=310355 RepID=UPI003612E612
MRLLLGAGRARRISRPAGAGVYSSDRVRAGSATAAVSSRTRSPAIRSAVARSNREVAYSSSTCTGLSPAGS